MVVVVFTKAVDSINRADNVAPDSLANPPPPGRYHVALMSEIASLIWVYFKHKDLYVILASSSQLERQ